MKQNVRNLVLGAVIFLVFTAIDLFAKHWIVSHYIVGQSRPIVPGLLNFTLVHNRGAAFGTGNTWSMWFFIGTSVVAIGVVLHLLLKLRADEKLSWWGLILILSGAVGNLVDRIRLGYVIDFIDVYYKNHHWWVFNVADAAITVGAVLFGFELLLKNPQKKSQKTQRQEDEEQKARH